MSIQPTLIEGSASTSCVTSDAAIKFSRFAHMLAAFPIESKRICLILPPSLDPKTLNPTKARFRSYASYPPYGLMVLASAVHRCKPDWTVEICDLSIEAINRAATDQPHDLASLLELVPSGCDAYGVSVMFECVQPIAQACIAHLTKRGCLILAGGAQATPNANDFLGADGCHAVLRREGEPQLLRLLEIWEKAREGCFEFNETYLPGNVTFRDESGICAFDARVEQGIPIDPRQAYSLINLDDYNRFSLPNLWSRTGAERRKWATILTNQGCRGRCTFCQVPVIWDSQVRSRSIDTILDEIRFLYNELDVRHLEILDDDLLFGRERILELLAGIKNLGYDLTFSTGNAVLAISITPEVAKAMVEAGFRVTGFGVETGNKARLLSLKKPASLPKVSEACGILKKNHPETFVFANFMIGFPDETIGEMLGTLEFARSLRIDYCQCSILNPLTGTAIGLQMANQTPSTALGKGTDKMMVHTPGQWLVSKGLTFDDLYTEIYDFRKLDPSMKAQPFHVQQFQIYFNVMVNLAGTINLQPGGDPERARKFTETLVHTYPMDAVSWGVHAAAHRLLGNISAFEDASRAYRKAVKDSRFWTRFFEIYETDRLIGIPLSET